MSRKGYAIRTHTLTRVMRAALKNCGRSHTDAARTFFQRANAHIHIHTYVHVHTYTQYTYALRTRTQSVRLCTGGGSAMYVWAEKFAKIGIPTCNR